MKDRLYIRLLADQESIEWGLLNHQEQVTSFLDRGHLLLQDSIALAEMAAIHPITLILPTSKVRNFIIDVPTRNRKQLEQAVPYLLEEQIIENVDTQHFAMGNFTAEGMLQVNVIDKEYLRNILAIFKSSSIEPDLVISDASCLPVFEDGWSLLQQDNVLVRQNQHEYWSAEQSIFADMIRWNLESLKENDENISQAIRIFYTQQATTELDGIEGLALQPIEIDDPFLWLVSQENEENLNLLQQEFSSNKKTSSNIGAAKWPLIAASVLLVTFVAYLSSNWFILAKERDSLQQQILQEVNKVSPGINNVNTAIAQVDNLFSRLGASADGQKTLISILDKSLKIINNTQVKVTQMEYQNKRGQLNLDIKASNYDALTNAQTALDQSGLNAELKNSRDNSGTWTARLDLKVKK